MDFNLFEDFSDSEDDTQKIEKQTTLLPWIEKYRPNSLDEMISHKEIIKTLRNFKELQNMQHLLFYGPAGTGKTSAILAFAKELYGKNFSFMVMELNASDDRGIEVVRNKIKQFVSSDSIFCKFTSSSIDTSKLFKLVILDEIDAMTDEAQAILRNVVESYTKQARFCLICNYLKKITPALQSRCVPFKFSPLALDDMKIKITNVVEKEKLNITTSGIDTIINRSKGDMRKALNMLQSSSMIYTIIDSGKIDKCFGYLQEKDTKKLVKYLLKRNIQECNNLILEICKLYGLTLTDIINELYDVYINAWLGKKYIVKDLKNINKKLIPKLLDSLREIEINTISSSSDNIQISGMVSLFKLIQ